MNIDANRLKAVGLGTSAISKLSEHGVRWEDLGVGDETAHALAAVGASEPFACQKTVVPAVLLDQDDVIINFPTGTGKTLAFLTIAIERVLPDASGPQSLILVPTRELADQIEDIADILTSVRYQLAADAAREAGTEAPRKIRVAAATAGAPASKFQGADIIVGTFGTVNALLNSHTLELDALQLLVIDEFDRMLDQQTEVGVAVSQLIENIPEDARIVFASATLSPAVRAVVLDHVSEARLLTDSTLTEGDKADAAGAYSAEHICPQFVVRVDQAAPAPSTTPATWAEKLGVLEKLLKELPAEFNKQIVVFANTRRAVTDIAARLSEAGRSVAALHAGVANRAGVMTDFRAGRVRVVVASDVIARGIDVVETGVVVNFDLPLTKPFIHPESGRPDRTREDERRPVPTEYRHRVGRAGRAGRKGAAISLVFGDVEAARMETVAQTLGFKSTVVDMEFNVVGDDEDDLIDRLCDVLDE